MSARVRISILSYDGAAFLPDAIESALAQTHLDVEVGVVDDGSTDGSREIVAAYADRGVRWEPNAENLGLSRNWTHAARDVDADYVAVLHQDDRLRPEFASRLVERLERAPAAVAAVANVQVVDRSLLPLDITRFELKRWRAGGPCTPADHERLLMGNFVYGCSWLARPALFADHEFSPDLGWVPDWDFWLTIMAQPERVLREPEILAEYRMHDESLSYDERTLLRRVGEEERVVEDALARRAVAPAVAGRARRMVDVRGVAYAAQVLAARRPRLATTMLREVARSRGWPAVARGAAGLALLPEVRASGRAAARRALARGSGA